MDHYVTDDGVFVKQRWKDPYYVVAKDYDDGSMNSYVVNNNVIYYNEYNPEEGERNSYHNFPSTCYKMMMDRSTLVSEDIRDGIIPKVNME